MKKKSRVRFSPSRHIPEVFKDTEGEIVARKNTRITQQLLDRDDIPENDGIVIDSPILPKEYFTVDKVPSGRELSQKQLYGKISYFTPYLIKNLLYTSQSPIASTRDRIQASKILLDKVMPNLSADHIRLETDNVQSLVIVKASVKDKDS